VVFFFQAEDGIRDFHVTGVQTCALPICNSGNAVRVIAESSEATRLTVEQAGQARESLGQIGGALRNLAVVNASIASTTLEQAQVIEDINRNIAETAALAREIEQSSDQTHEAGQHLNQLAAHLSRLLSQF